LPIRNQFPGGLKRRINRESDGDHNLVVTMRFITQHLFLFGPPAQVHAHTVLPQSLLRKTAYRDRHLNRLGRVAVREVFAPSDDAFAKIPKDKLEALLADKAKLKSVLLAHVLTGKVLAADVLKMKDGTKVKNVAGTELAVGIKGSTVSIGGAHVTKTDIDASNGVIHVIDSVIL